MNNHEIIEFYKCGNSLAATSRKAKISIYKIKKILQKDGVEIRKRYQQAALENIKRSKSIRHYFFRELNLLNSYYLGFLSATARISKSRNLIKITLLGIEKDFLKEFKIHLATESEVKIFTTRHGLEFCELSFSSLEIKRDLLLHSGTMQHIPDDLKLAFIKGYYDAEGGIEFSTCQLNLFSEKIDLLNEIRDFLKAGNIQKIRKEYLLRFSDVDSYRILNDLYNLNGKTPYIPRKKEKFEKAISIRIQNSPRVKDSANADEKVR